MLQSSNASQATQLNAVANGTPNSIIECVRKVASALGCAGIWARTTGPYILLGHREGDAFARLTALGGASYGLAFREASAGDKRARPAGWAPVTLIDELADAVEHALVGVGASTGTSTAKSGLRAAVH